MTTSERILCILYLKSRNAAAEGYPLETIRKLLFIPPDNFMELVYDLIAKKLATMYADHKQHLLITPEGLNQASAVLGRTNSCIVQFLSARYLPPTGRAVDCFSFDYNLTERSKSEANYSISVIISFEAGSMLSLSYDKNGSGQKVLSQFAREYITNKLKEGTLQQHEDFEIMTKTLNHYTRHEPSDLVDLEDLIFIVEI